MRKLILSVGIVAAAFTATSAFAEGDPAAGEKVFRKCKACHMVGEDAKNRVGPVLNGVIGRQAGTFDGYRYSPAMKKAGENGLVWTEEKLHHYLEKPRDMVKGTKMAFPGLKKEKDRENVVSYLEQFSK